METYGPLSYYALGRVSPRDSLRQPFPLRKPLRMRWFPAAPPASPTLQITTVTVSDLSAEETPGGGVG